ncbi:hypothetical protein [Massilia varians]|uniref:hypothetical protein n=1 Tax=Massilia varians TaxID=457921 RepID=UPI0024938045|nr:hypothetical protein [Massilia varians]
MFAATPSSQREVIASRCFVSLIAPIKIFSKLIVLSSSELTMRLSSNVLQPPRFAASADSRNQRGKGCQRANDQLADQVSINHPLDRIARLCVAAKANNQPVDHLVIDVTAVLD